MLYLRQIKIFIKTRVLYLLEIVRFFPQLNEKLVLQVINHFIRLNFHFIDISNR